MCESCVTRADSLAAAGPAAEKEEEEEEQHELRRV
jgi:hypothetical protein